MRSALKGLETLQLNGRAGAYLLTLVTAPRPCFLNFIFLRLRASGFSEPVCTGCVCMYVQDIYCMHACMHALHLIFHLHRMYRKVPIRSLFVGVSRAQQRWLSSARLVGVPKHIPFSCRTLFGVTRVHMLVLDKVAVLEINLPKCRRCFGRREIFRW